MDAKLVCQTVVVALTRLHSKSNTSDLYSLLTANVNFFAVRTHRGLIDGPVDIVVNKSSLLYQIVNYLIY
jgi:hypothetical protein